MPQSESTRIVFLYSELAEYFVACVRALATHFPCEITLIRWKVNEEAPFQFQFPSHATVYTKSDYTPTEISKICTDARPQIVVVSGWMDKDYLKIIAQLRSQNPSLPVISGLDNPWEGNWKQTLGAFPFGKYLKKYFTHIWCTGARQYEFARRLGFDRQQILWGFYSADVPNFFASSNISPSKTPTILHIGRLLDWKGISELCAAFVELQTENPNEWQLRLIGRGPMKEQIPKHPQIEVQDFVQPKEVATLMQQAGCFVLASWEEHWGVTVHEAAAAGCPLLVSEGVGAGTAFVKDGYNGFVFSSKNKNALKISLQKMMQLTEAERQEMGKRSQEQALQITPQIWATTLMSVLIKK